MKQVDQPGETPLSPTQHWFLRRDRVQAHHFNQSMMMVNRGGFNQDYVLAAFEAICRHHDVLRTVFSFDGPNAVQSNRPPDAPPVDMMVIPLEAVPVHELEEKIETEAAALQASIDLSRGPLVKLGLFKTEDGDHLLIIIHHLVIDGFSWRILLEDFDAAYTMAENGFDIRFQAKTDSFLHWSYRLSAYAASDKALNELVYWRGIDEAAAATVPLHKDFKLEPAHRRHKDTDLVISHLEENQTLQLLKDVHYAYNTCIDDILFSALTLTVCGWTSKPRVVIDLEGHGREPIISDIDISRTVGWFTIKYPVVLEAGGNKELSLVIKDVKELLREVPNRGIGYGILRYLTPADKKGNYRFKAEPEIIFNFLGQTGEGGGSSDSPEESTGIQFSHMPKGPEKSPDSVNPYALAVSAIVMGGRLHFSFSYNQKEYRRETMTLLTESYRENLLRIIHHCLRVETTGMTAGDFDAVNLDKDELDAIYDETE